MTENTVIFISGVSSGIGKAMVEYYLSKPSHIVIGSVRNLGAPVVSELQSITPASGSTLLLVHIESANPSDPAKALTEIEKAHVDHIDIVFANAGGSPPVVDIDHVSPEDCTYAFQTNALGPLVLFQTLKPLLQKSSNPKWASITSISGSIGTMAGMGTHITPAYGAAKAALNWWTHAIHHTQPWLVTLLLHPGLVQTGPGNWIARKVGLEEAPTTIDESVSALIKKVEGATRDNFSGKYIDVIQDKELPW